MAGTTFLYQIVIFTHQHSISGGIFLHEQRLSDFLNDRREMNVALHNASVARLENPGKVLKRTTESLVPKSGIVLAFEPPQKSIQLPQRFIKKYPKDKHEVYLILDGMEVHGEVHVPGVFAQLQFLTDAGDSFLPLTHATVTIEANPNFLLRQEAVMINPRHIRFFGETEPKNTPEPV
jgi:hypothetical protein